MVIVITNRDDIINVPSHLIHIIHIVRSLMTGGGHMKTISYNISPKYLVQTREVNGPIELLKSHEC